MNNSTDGTQHNLSYDQAIIINMIESNGGYLSVEGLSVEVLAICDSLVTAGIASIDQHTIEMIDAWRGMDPISGPLAVFTWPDAPAKTEPAPTVQIGLFGEDKALRKAKRPAAQQFDMFAGQWDFGKTARPVDKDWKGKLGLSMQDNPNGDDKPAPGQQSFI